MYRKHFGLTRIPFAKEIEPDDLFTTASYTELELRLKHLFEMRGIGLVTGESGCGKTTAIRRVVSGLHAGLYKPIYVCHTTGNIMDVYKTIAWELGLACERSRAALFRQIRAEVTRLCSESRTRPIFILDEAQNLRSDVLEDLRLLTNYQMDAENRVCILFLGQPELRRRLSMAAYDSLSQRIVARFHMTGLGRDELEPYLTHLLRRAGTELQLFDPPAQEALFQAASGLPRKINGLAHHCLMAAALARAKTVNTEHVHAALTEVS
ncbi:MAG: AAA family ATPase [Nitrospiraceae bacterium]|nr:AAA family ATPase [Nitrospiraceae bacterium]